MFVITNEKIGRYVPLNGIFSKNGQKTIDMFPRTDAKKNSPQTSIPSNPPMWSA